MVERFYSIKHLSTDMLREFYTSNIKYGWKDADFHSLAPNGIKPPELSNGEIILNINADNEHNYFVFMLDYEGEQDGVMIGFGLSYYPDFSVFLHLPPMMLDELIEKYSLYDFHQAKDTSEMGLMIENGWEWHLN